MATVSISPSPQNISMSTRRIPLSNNPNATNSPFRSLATTAGKRSRSYSSVQREIPYGQPPPLKKQMMEAGQPAPRTPPRQQSSQAVFSRKRANPQPAVFDRKNVAARDRQVQQKDSRVDRASQENLETIRQWQRHYRRVFPQYVFYFESIPEDFRLKCSRQVISLGAVRSFISSILLLA
jgi:regulatory subunit for Cdc7p protein kinase